MKSESKKEFVPGYVRLGERLIRDIHDGKYRPGGRLPAIRKLAEEYGAGRQLIYHALHFLATQNYVYTEPKKGVFVNPEMSAGRYYQIGLYLQDGNPLGEGEMFPGIMRAARDLNFRVAFGFSYNGRGESFSDFLKSVPQLDGVLVTGEINNAFLRDVRASRLPYLVMGNYDILPCHPQVRVDIPALTEATLVPVFKPFRNKKIAALVGDASYQADLDIAEGIRRAIRAVNPNVAADQIRHCEADGYPEVVTLMREKRPDVLFIQGPVLCRGYQKLCRLHPELKAPYTICNTFNTLNRQVDAIIDKKVCCSWFTTHDAERAVRELVDMTTKMKE